MQEQTVFAKKDTVEDLGRVGVGNGKRLMRDMVPERCVTQIDVCTYTLLMMDNS